MSSIPDPALPARRALRQRLLGLREQFAASGRAADAAEALAQHLAALLARLEPQCLGVYVPMRGEFDPQCALDLASRGTGRRPAWPLALPYCKREPREMHYRQWDGSALAAQDECRIAASNGALAAPDVVLAPCVGFTTSGYRLGYGGGYFDRWQARHAGACVIGVAWCAGEIEEAEFAPRAHDIALPLIVTEEGVLER